MNAFIDLLIKSEIKFGAVSTNGVGVICAFAIAAYIVAKTLPHVKSSISSKADSLLLKNLDEQKTTHLQSKNKEPDNSSL